MKTIIFLIFCSIYFDKCFTQTNWKLIWQDEFNTLDSKTWQIEVNCDGGGNNELQCYTDAQKNVQVQDGKLILTAVPENHLNKQYTSGRIKQISNGFLYGKMEARCKLPEGKHLWPAFWMLPQDWAYGGWAASGEIDILEYRGQKTDLIEGTLHFGGAWPNNIYQGSGPKSMGVDLSKDFHNYAVEWDPNEIRWYFDGRQYHSMTLDRSFWAQRGSDPYNGRQRAPFDKAFRFIFNLAIGGNFFPANVYGTLSVEEARNWPNPKFIIDWVRVYQKDGGSAPQPTSSPPPPTKPNCCIAIRLGNVCYDPNTHHCVKDDKGQTVLCAKTDGACNGSCYDAANYNCVNGSLVHK